MDVFVLYVFIFSVGSIFGWVLEVIYRHLADKDKRWFNPGFCVGPWLPIYGVGLLTAFLMTGLENNYVIDNIVLKRLLLFFMTSVCMTIIELIGGILLLKFFNLRLWDYRDEKFNYKGFICLKFSFFWMLISAVYYFLIHPNIYGLVKWLSSNLAFSFVVGFFIGIFAVDFIYSGNVLAKVRDYAVEKGIIVKLEDLKEKIQREKKVRSSKMKFFIFMLKENLAKHIDSKMGNTKDSTIENE